MNHFPTLDASTIDGCGLPVSLEKAVKANADSFRGTRAVAGSGELLTFFFPRQGWRAKDAWGFAVSRGHKPLNIFWSSGEGFTVTVL